jgi:hypothetical protein
MEQIKKLREYTLSDAINSMGWFSRLCLLGGCFLFIDSLFELISSPFGYLSLIFSLVILILSVLIQDDNPFAYMHTIIVLILNYIIQIYLHQTIGINWTTGLGFIGYVLLNIVASIVLLLIILSIGDSVNKDPVDDKWLFFVGYLLLSINLIIYLISLDWVLVQSSMLAIFYFAMITICIILVLLDQKLMGGFTIWVISAIIIFGGMINSPLSSPVSGFGAGLTIVGNIALVYGLNDLGFLYAKEERIKKV